MNYCVAAADPIALGIFLSVPPSCSRSAGLGSRISRGVETKEMHALEEVWSNLKQPRRLNFHDLPHVRLACHDWLVVERKLDRGLGLEETR